MKHLWFAALALVASCSFPESRQAPTGVAPARGPGRSSVVPAVFYRAGDFVFGRAVRLEELKLSHGPMLSVAVARVKNVAGLPYNLQYRFRFYEESGMEVKNEESAKWKTFEIEAGAAQTLTGGYPSESILKAGLEVRETDE